MHWATPSRLDVRGRGSEHHPRQIRSREALGRGYHMHPSSLLSLSPSRRPQLVSVRPALDSSTLSSLAKVKSSRIVHQSRSWGSASLGRFPLLLLLPKIYGFSPVICRYHPPSLGSQYTRSRNGTKELYGVVCLAVQDGGLGSVELEERGPMIPSVSPQTTLQGG